MVVLMRKKRGEGVSRRIQPEGGWEVDTWVKGGTPEESGAVTKIQFEALCFAVDLIPLPVCPIPIPPKNKTNPFLQNS